MRCFVVGDRKDIYPRRLADEMKTLFLPVDMPEKEKEYKAREIKPVVDFSGMATDGINRYAALMAFRENRLDPDANAYEKRMALTANVLMNDPRTREAAGIAALIPYFFYARQDKAFILGEPESLAQTADAISEYADTVFTTDSHMSGRAGRALSDYFSRTDVLDICMAKPIADVLKAEYGVKRPLIVNPDDEHPERLGGLMSQFEGSKFGYVIQDRDPLTGTKVVKGSKFEAKDEEVVVGDDLSETAGTLIRAVEEVKRQGPAGIYVVVSHMFTSEPIEKLGKLVRDGTVRAVLTTDSFRDSDDSCARNGITVVDTTKFVANYIREYEDDV